jgi:hypothetical protein
MASLEWGSDETGVSMRSTLALLTAALALTVLVGVGAGTSATSGSRACLAAGAKHGGYTYAGHQATRTGHGVRATITAIREPDVAAGHVAGWIGLGGPGLGPNGTDMWIQAGIASVPGLGTFVYAEIARPGRSPQFVLLEEDVPVGKSRRLAVLEMSKRPERWRVWVDGEPVTKPIYLRGSAERWAPIATAESWNGGERTCNRFAFRFERVSVSHGRGGSWFAFRPGYRFQDGDYLLRQLAAAPQQGSLDRQLSRQGPDPYAFLAATR